MRKILYLLKWGNIESPIIKQMCILSVVKLEPWSFRIGTVFPLFVYHPLLKLSSSGSLILIFVTAKEQVLLLSVISQEGNWDQERQVKYLRTPELARCKAASEKWLARLQNLCSELWWQALFLEKKWEFCRFLEVRLNFLCTRPTEQLPPCVLFFPKLLSFLNYSVYFILTRSILPPTTFHLFWVGAGPLFLFPK